MKPYRYAIVVDAARKLECRESIAESVVHLIAAKHTAGWDTSDIAAHLAAHLGEQNPASARDFVQSVVDQYAATCGKCGTRSPLRPGDPSVYGRFCDDCISRCHDDDQHGHWCAIDRYAEEAEQAG